MTLPHGLTEDQKAFFHREGYLVLENLFDEADLQPAIDDIEAAIDTLAADALANGTLSRDYAEYDFEHRLARINAEDQSIASALWDGKIRSPGVFEIIRNPKLLDVAESLCGEELIASSVYRLRPKVPTHHKSAVPWHQDSGYFEPYCDENLVLTVWTPLVDATDANGCLYVIPRSHTEGIIRHYMRQQAYLMIRDEDLPAGERVCCEVPKGGVLLLTNKTVHGSFDNDTDGVRWSMDLRYQNAALPTNAPISRLKNEDTPRGESAEDPDFVPVACYPPEADFLIRSKQRPDEILDDPEAFARLRAEHQSRPVTQRWDAVEA
jgi:ectoine hydroxylase-related dioxygenase (phytanoyl-CoA dioxygenase family)